MTPGEAVGRACRNTGQSIEHAHALGTPCPEGLGPDRLEVGCNGVVLTTGGFAAKTAGSPRSGATGCGVATWYETVGELWERIRRRQVALERAFAADVQIEDCTVQLPARR